MIVATAGNLADRPREAGRRASSHHAHAIERVDLAPYARQPLRVIEQMLTIGCTSCRGSDRVIDEAAHRAVVHQVGVGRPLL